MTENILPKDEYDAAIEQVSLLTQELENAEPARQEEIWAQIHRLIAQAVDGSLTDEEKQFRDHFVQHNVDVMENMVIPTQKFAYPAAKVIVQQPKRDIQIGRAHV